MGTQHGEEDDLRRTGHPHPYILPQPQFFSMGDNNLPAGGEVVNLTDNYTHTHVSSLLVMIIINYQVWSHQLGCTGWYRTDGRYQQSQDHREDPGGRDLNLQL